MNAYGNSRRDNISCKYGCCCNKCGPGTYRHAAPNHKTAIRAYGRGKARTATRAEIARTLRVED